MKIKKIAALCSRAGTFRLYDKVDQVGVVTQWLGDGNAIYPLLGAPMLDENSLCAVFDITEKKKENLSILHEEMPQTVNTNDMFRGDFHMDTGRVSICYDGATILPLRAKDGIVFIQEKYLEPLEDEGDLLELYERKFPNGEPYVAVKAGMMLRAIICTYKVNGEFASLLETIAHGCRKGLEKNSPKTDETQESFFRQAKSEETARESEEG